MTVRELLDLLTQCDPDALVVANLAFRGMTEITSVERTKRGAIGRRMSFEEVAVVDLSNGNVPHMRSQGLDALPAGAGKGEGE